MKATTDFTITTAAALLQDIEAAEARGYAQTKGENVADVVAVSCPVRLEGAVYAIAIAGPHIISLGNMGAPMAANLVTRIIRPAGIKPA